MSHCDDGAFVSKWANAEAQATSIPDEMFVKRQVLK